jgi:hypothetical protein
MKTSVHSRFAAYAVLVTAAFAGLAFFPSSKIPGALLFLSGFALGQSKRAFVGPQPSISGRALIWGFLGFLIVVWIGALVFAHRISPGHWPVHLLWIGGSLAYLCALYAGFRWLRVEKRVEVDA